MILLTESSVELNLSFKYIYYPKDQLLVYRIKRSEKKLTIQTDSTVGKLNSAGLLINSLIIPVFGILFSFNTLVLS